MPQAAQKQMPVRSVGPLTMRGAVHTGLRALRSACTGADTSRVEMLGDGLDPHRPRGAVALPGQAEDQQHGLGLEGIDLQGLLDPMAALLAGYDAVADRRQRAIPETLPRVLL